MTATIVMPSLSFYLSFLDNNLKRSLMIIEIEGLDKIQLTQNHTYIKNLEKYFNHNYILLFSNISNDFFNAKLCQMNAYNYVYGLQKMRSPNIL